MVQLQVEPHSKAMQICFRTIHRMQSQVVAGYRSGHKSVHLPGQRGCRRAAAAAAGAERRAEQRGCRQAAVGRGQEVRLVGMVVAEHKQEERQAAEARTWAARLALGQAWEQSRS